MNADHHLYAVNGTWYVRFARQGAKVRISTRTQDVARARSARDELLRGPVMQSDAARQILSRAPVEGSPKTPDEKTVRAIAAAMWKRAKARAKTRHRAFRLSIEDIRLLLVQSGWRCTVSGIPFEVSWDYVRSRGPFKPSLDRIDSSKRNPVP